MSFSMSMQRCAGTPVCAPMVGVRRGRLTSFQVRAAAGVAPGKVYLVGAGPGTSDYLTLKGARLLGSCDVVVYDDLTHPSILELVRPGAEKRYVGKRGGNALSFKQGAINDIMAEEAKMGRTVVRLKGGDPGIFGRVGPEVTALEAAGLQYEVVPGVSSVLAAPLLAGVALTDVDCGRHLVVCSAHNVPGIDFSLFRGIDTLVFLMAGKALPDIVRLTQELSGRKPSTPIMVVRWAGTPEQKQWEGTLGNIMGLVAGEEDLSPAIVTVGDVVAASRERRRLGRAARAMEPSGDEGI